MYALVAFLVGCVVTLMNGINSLLALRVGNVVSLVAIHLSGLVGVSLLLLLRAEGSRGGGLPFYYYGAGVVGVATVLGSNLCYGELGASLSVALALFGQMTGALVVDGLGLFGMPRRRHGTLQYIGLAIALAAVLVMTDIGSFGSPLMVLAFGTGLTTLAGFGLNARLAGSIGSLKATRVNYVAGLLTSLVVVALVRPPLRELPGVAAGLSPLLIVGGGLMGVGVVAGMSRIFPRIPASTSTLLLFSGQVMAGLALDAVLGRYLPPRRIAGAALLILALALQWRAESGAGRRPPPGAITFRNR